MRRRLDSLLAAPGLTRGRFAALAVVSLIATTVVVVAGLRQDQPPYGLLAAAYSRPASRVEVARAPQAAPVVDASVPTSASDAGASADNAATSAPVAAAVAPSAAVGAYTAAPAPVSQSPATQTTPAPTPTTPTKPASKVKHVFVIDLAGAGYDATWGDGSVATYLNTTLRPQGRLLADYHPLAAGDLATQIALVGGQKPTPGIEQGCPTYGGDCLFPVETLSLPDQLVSSGHTWRGYFEDMPKPCAHPDLNASEDPASAYTTRHNPFVYFRSLTDLGECLSNDLPLDSLTTDLATEQATPNFVFVAPNLCHGGWQATCADGSPGGLTAADAFLAEWAPKILDSAAYKSDGLLVVLFGGQPEGQPPDANTGALLVSQFAQAGSSSQTPYDAYGVLRSIEDLFGLSNLGDAAANTATSFAKTELAAGLP